MSKLYDRRYRVSVTFFNGTSISVSEQRCTFSFRKALSQTMQYGEVTIYNLSGPTQTDIFQNAKYVTIEAGYVGGEYGIIFQGSVRQPILGKENGTDYYITLGCIDGDDSLNLAFTETYTGAGMLPEQLVQQIVRASNVPFQFKILGQLSQQKTERGKVLFGQTKGLLQNIATNENAALYSDNGTLTLGKLDTPPPPIVPELNFQTGLIGTPRQADQGVAARSLIRPSFTLNSWLKLNNRNIILANTPFQGRLNPNVLDLDGLYRIIAIEVTGDTRGNDWYYDLELLSQAGRNPLITAQTGQYGY